MSGTCSAHKHYERDCPRCQTEKPEWVQALEVENVTLKALVEEAVPMLRLVPQAGAWFTHYDALTKEETP